jgi:hypothetical protein
METEITICGFCGKIIFDFEKEKYFRKYHFEANDTTHDLKTVIRALNYPEW